MREGEVRYQSPFPCIVAFWYHPEPVYVQWREVVVATGPNILPLASSSCK